MGFQVMQSVRVKNEKLEHDGQAGHVVEAVSDHDTTSKVSVKMDSDNEVYEFEQADIVAL
jgi:uncharacterized protein YkuJ